MSTVLLTEQENTTVELTPELLYLRTKVHEAWASNDANFREYYDSALLEVLGVSTFKELEQVFNKNALNKEPVI